jgi:hypothetical protein
MKTIELKGSAVSKAVRDLLKIKYPKSKFSVRYDSFAGGDAVRIEYEYGPDLASVEYLTNPFQQGHFDGMTDSYEYHPNRIVEMKEGEIMLSGGVKYITVSKPFPKDMFELWRQEAFKILVGLDDPNELASAVRIVYNKTDFQSSNPKNAKLVARLVHFGPIWSRLQFDFAPETEPAEPGKIEVLLYSDYSFAVFGPAFQHSTQLREVGNYNKFLKHPLTKEKTPGWIFATKNMNRVKEILQLP